MRAVGHCIEIVDEGELGGILAAVPVGARERAQQGRVHVVSPGVIEDAEDVVHTLGKTGDEEPFAIRIVVNAPPQPRWHVGQPVHRAAPRIRAGGACGLHDRDLREGPALARAGRRGTRGRPPLLLRLLLRLQVLEGCPGAPPRFFLAVPLLAQAAIDLVDLLLRYALPKERVHEIRLIIFGAGHALNIAPTHGFVDSPRALPCSAADPGRKCPHRLAPSRKRTQGGPPLQPLSSPGSDGRRHAGELAVGAIAGPATLDERPPPAVRRIPREILDEQLRAALLVVLQAQDPAAGLCRAHPDPQGAGALETHDGAVVLQPDGSRGQVRQTVSPQYFRSGMRACAPAGTWVTFHSHTGETRSPWSSRVTISS